MKINNISRLVVTRDGFIAAWVQILLPFHRLRPMETKLGVELIKLREDLGKSGMTQDAIKSALLSRHARETICNTLNVSLFSFKTMLSALRKVGFIKDDDVNPRFMPRLAPGEKQFRLLYHFDIKDNGEADEHDEG